MDKKIDSEKYMNSHFAKGIHKLEKHVVSALGLKQGFGSTIQPADPDLL